MLNYNNMKVDFDIDEITISFLEGLILYSFVKCDFHFFKINVIIFHKKYIYKNEIDKFFLFF